MPQQLTLGNGMTGPSDEATMAATAAPAMRRPQPIAELPTDRGEHGPRGRPGPNPGTEDGGMIAGATTTADGIAVTGVAAILLGGN